MSEHKSFGMIMYPAHEDVTINYGTMLQIKSVKILSDGRSVMETWGTHRFRILNRGESDGCMMAQVARYVAPFAVLKHASPYPPPPFWGGMPQY